MNYATIILSIGVILSVLLFQKTKPNILKGIFIGLILSIGLSFFRNEFLEITSFFAFGFLTFIFLIYSVINKKWLPMAIALFAFLSFLFKYFNLPYSYELKLSMLVPILCYISIFKNKEFYKMELSILTILIIYELSEFIELIKLWLY